MRMERIIHTHAPYAGALILEPRESTIDY